MSWSRLSGRTRCCVTTGLGARVPRMKARSLDGGRTRVVMLALSLSFALAGPRIAQADLIVPPPPDCVGQPPGARCVRFNGTAGRCVHTPDSRRPGRVNIVCEADSNECDSLAIGAECHGYLGRAAHCREFSDDASHRRWRACVADESQPDATPPAQPSQPAPTTQPAPSQTAAPAQPPATRSSGCSVSTGAQRASSSAWVFAALALAALARRRR